MSGGVERSANLKIRHSQHPILSAARHVRLQPVLGFREGSLHTKATHLVIAGCPFEVNVFEARVDGIDRGVLLLIDGFHVLFAADLRRVNLARRPSRRAYSQTPCRRPTGPAPCCRCSSHSRRWRGSSARRPFLHGCQAAGLRDRTAACPCLSLGTRRRPDALRLPIACTATVRAADRY